jgi:sugar phosphate isomerase/epimerase
MARGHAPSSNTSTALPSRGKIVEASGFLVQVRGIQIIPGAMKTTRRRFLGVCALAALPAFRTLDSTAAETRAIPIGFQLYTVRGELAKNVPETLKAIAAIGYRGVEFWGYAGSPNIYQQLSARELRKMLDDHGLRCCGIHLDLKALAKDNFERAIENNGILGNEYLNVAAAQEKMRTTETITEFAELLNERAGRARTHKMRMGYHAHPFDFARIKDQFAWEILFSKLEPEVNMQMDVGNCLAGNGDPLAILKKFPNRTWTIHIKEHEEKTFDSDFYREVFRLCESTSGTRWYIVEMGGQGGNGFDVPRQALEKLHRLGK